ncbi:hypothetical protein SNE40_010542 [Patella caerulea]|uniref:C-type lectin domain-containing protein n=1 Tax=Patella caerulea TaxID=87958 RepID=A0AAN8PRR1_PATCE
MAVHHILVLFALSKLDVEGMSFQQTVNRELVYTAVPLNFRRASKVCEQLGGIIAPLKTRMDDMLISAIRGKNDIWIGGTDREIEGEFRWLDGDLLNYTNWRQGEPNNAKGDEDCMISEGNRRKQWDDRPCHIRLPFVCAIDVDSVDSKYLLFI